MNNLKRQSVGQFLDNPVFEQCFPAPESKARVRAVVKWAHVQPHRRSEKLLAQHSQDLVSLKDELRRVSDLYKGDAKVLNMIRSSLESWPLVLLLNVAQEEDLGQTLQLLAPLLENWRVEADDSQHAALSLFDHLLKDLVELVIEAPVLSSGTWLDLSNALQLLMRAFGDNQRAVVRLRLLLVRRVDRIVRMATSLTDNASSGDTLKVKHILLELKSLGSIPGSCSALMDSVRFLTPSIFTLCHHIWSQGPVRLGSPIFLLTMDLFKNWTCFVSDSSEERATLAEILEQIGANDNLLDKLTSSAESHQPHRLPHQVLDWLESQVKLDDDSIASASPRARGVLDKLSTPEDDKEWRMQGLVSTVRILQVITGAEIIQQWKMENRKEFLEGIATGVLSIVDSCFCGIGKVEVLENVARGEHSHLFYLVKWCILILTSQDVFVQGHIPFAISSLVVPSIEAVYKRVLRDLEHLDMLALSLSENEVIAKLAQIETGLKYCQALSISYVTENTIEVFCNFLVDRLMISRSSVSNSHFGLELMTNVASRSYLFTAKESPPRDIFHQDLGGQFYCDENFIFGSMQRLLNFSDRCVFSILKVLLLTVDKDATFGLRKSLETLGLDSSISVYEWQQTWMFDTLRSRYNALGKAVYWRRRLLIWFCCYMWLRHSEHRLVLCDPALFETLISCATLGILELETQRLKHDSFTRHCDQFGTLLALECVYLLLRDVVATQPASAHTAAQVERHVSVVTPLLVLVAVAGTAAQLSVLTRILRLLEPPCVPPVDPGCVLRRLCERHHRRVLRVFTSKVSLGDDTQTLPSPAEQRMWESLSLLVEFLGGEALVTLGLRLWDDLRWCTGLSVGCSHFLARLSFRLCEELHKTRGAAPHTTPRLATHDTPETDIRTLLQDRLNDTPDDTSDTLDEEQLDTITTATTTASLPDLGVRPQVWTALGHNEDYDDKLTVWQNWRTIADAIILKMGATLAANRGDPNISHPCLAALFNCLYLHTTQARGYLSRLHQVWRCIQPLFSNCSLRASDLSVCLEGMEFSMLKYAGSFFESRFHDDIQPVLTRYMLEIALDDSIQMTRSQVQCVLMMLKLVTSQSLVMRFPSVRTQTTCLCSILIATRGQLCEEVKQAATGHLIELHRHHPEICDRVFSALLRGSSASDNTESDSATTESAQVLQLINVYDPMKTRGSTVEALQQTILRCNVCAQ